MAGGNNNVTVAIPGTSTWGVHWQVHSWDAFQLDIVGFLAILGESAVLANAQVSALSRLFYLPRLLPAPQALLRTTRPTTLPTTPAKVTGVASGMVKDHLHHIASILLAPEMPSYSVRLITIRKGKDADGKESFPTANRNGPQAWVTGIGCLLAVAMFAISIIFGDGFSILASIMLSLLSTVVGFNNKWHLRLQKPSADDTPDGDVVVRYPNGSFIVVRCTEKVARELFSAPEEIEYLIKEAWMYQMLSLTGTVMLMLGIVFLANAKLQLQIAWAGAYVVINIAHWIAAALNPRRNWNLDCYDLEENEYLYGDPATFAPKLTYWQSFVETIRGPSFLNLEKVDGKEKKQKQKQNYDAKGDSEEDRDADEAKVAEENQPKRDPIFTIALWEAIKQTEDIKWAEMTGDAAVPGSALWKTWLTEAGKQVKTKEGRDTWDPKQHWGKLYKEHKDAQQLAKDAAEQDTASNHEPPHGQHIDVVAEAENQENVDLPNGDRPQHTRTQTKTW